MDCFWIGSITSQYRETGWIAFRSVWFCENCVLVHIRLQSRTNTLRHTGLAQVHNTEHSLGPHPENGQSPLVHSSTTLFPTWLPRLDTILSIHLQSPISPQIPMQLLDKTGREYRTRARRGLPPPPASSVDLPQCSKPTVAQFVYLNSMPSWVT